MGAGMGGLGPYGPFVALDRMAAQTQAMQLANQLTGNQLQGQGVLGAAMMQPGFGGGMPGGSPGYNPATPAPGQASQPLQITPNGVTGIPGGQPMPPDPAQPLSIPPMPSSPAGGAQAASAGGMPPSQPVSLTGADATQALAGQGAPSGQPGAPAQPSSETGAPGQQQVLSLDKVLGSIVKANPKASPKDIYNAAALYLPFMQEQDQALLRQALYSSRYGVAEINAQSREAVGAGHDTTRLAAIQAANDRAKQTITFRYTQLAQQAQQASDKAKAIGDFRAQEMADKLASQIRARQATAAQALLTAQDPAAAEALAAQTEAEATQMQQQLDALTSQGGGGTANSPAPKVRNLKVIPGATPPVSSGVLGGFQ